MFYFVAYLLIICYKPFIIDFYTQRIRFIVIP